MSEEKKQPQVRNLTEAENDEIARIEAALNWSIAQSPDGKRCPYCGAQPQFDSKNKDGFLREHLRKHTARMCQAHGRGSIEELPLGAVDEGDRSWTEELGLTVGDTRDKVDLLEVPAAIRKEYIEKRGGGEFYYVTAESFDRYLHKGYEPVLNKQGDTNITGDTASADGQYRVREMRLMYKSPEVTARVKRERAARVDNSIRNRKEVNFRLADGAAKEVYDTVIKRTGDSTAARNAANVAHRMAGFLTNQH